LSCELTISNPDTKPLPCGLGSHPYFRLPLGAAKADACRVVLPVGAEWELVDMLPTGKRLEADPKLAGGLEFESLKLDNVFTSLQRDDRWFRAEIREPGGGRCLSVAFDDSFSECVVYTPPHREAICIEPYSCVPGAASRSDFEHGWKVLAPDETMTSRVVVALE